MTQLPVQPAWRLAECPEQRRWLVDGLWSEEAVGIIGGEPKCCKSFLALDLAVAVAAGTPCLRRFTVTRPGRVLLYPAEDALHVVRRRLEGICAAAGVSLAELDVQVITAPSLRLDLEADRARLDETVARLKPRLLVLDPFVRLHRIDENVSGEVAPLLAFLRDLQRRHAIAVAVVHHARKGAGAIRAGQALRGSSEFHAWGDSNLYLRRDSEDRIVLTVEHRAAAAMPGVTLELTQRDDALALEPGRARWKIENETFNVLKTNGYNLEHNFGHGKETLASVLVTLNLLAFGFHTAARLAVLAWRQAVIARGPTYRFFEHLRMVTVYVVFENWDHLLRSIEAAAVRPP